MTPSVTMVLTNPTTARPCVRACVRACDRLKAHANLFLITSCYLPKKKILSKIYIYVITTAEGGGGEQDAGDSGDGDFVIKRCHRCVGGLGRAWK